MQTRETQPRSPFQAEHAALSEVTNWTGLFDTALDEELVAVQERAQEVGLPYPQTNRDLFEINTLIVSPEELSASGPELFYFHLGKSIGRRIHAHPERDVLTQQAALYTASLSIGFIEEYAPIRTQSVDADTEEERVARNAIQAGMQLVAAGIVASTKSSTDFPMLSHVVQTDGSVVDIFKTAHITWQGRTTRDRVFYEFGKEMRAYIAGKREEATSDPL